MGGVHRLEVTDFAQNCRIVVAKEGNDCVVLDPGGDTDKVLNLLDKNKLNCLEIWLTHSHLDHCGGVKSLKEATGAKLLGHPVEAMFRASVEEVAKHYGVQSGKLLNCPEPDVYIEGGEQLSFGGWEFEVLFTPGHSPGHLCFYAPRESILLAGDTVFAGSIGRTDLPGADYASLMKSIKDKILTLPPETRIMSGHGPDTTVEVEKVSNPFLRN